MPALRGQGDAYRADSQYTVTRGGYINTDISRLPKRGSYVGQSLKFCFVIVMCGFALSVMIQFGYWMVKNLEALKVIN